METAIELKGLTKRFGEVLANDHVSLSVRRGEILALLGENGSGKTTLMNMLSGIYQPDEGKILIGGKSVNISSPGEAIKLGVGMIHQHFKLVEPFTARENILLGEGAKRLKEPPETLCARYHLSVDLNKRVCDMSVGEKQTVEIVKVLSRGADTLILDEPTAVLTPQEIDALFNILRLMKKDEKAVIIITHKLDEVLSVSDRVTVLRKGKTVADRETESVDRFRLTELMVGRKVDLDIHREILPRGQELLTVQGLSVAGAEEGRMALDNVSFSLYAGEILGVAGVAGSGQKALCEAIAGLQRPAAGTILMDGDNITGLSPREIIRRGVTMAFVPEDRLGMGLAGGMSIVDNLLLKTYRRQKGVFLSRKGARAGAQEMIKSLSISTPSPNIRVSKLSGGNVQKVLLGREISLNPRVLVTAYPVRGLDVGASMTIYDLLAQQKKKGVGVLFVGEDLDVLLSLCDRIMVLSGGKMTALMPARFATKTLLGMKMAGLTTDKEDAYV